MVIVGNMANSDRFKIKIVKDKFKLSLLDEDDVRLQEYLESFQELNKFFALMGTVFGFVSQDLTAKIDILKDLLEKDEKKFSTVKEMIEHEKSNNLLDNKGYTSGSRTLLRIHRGLEFIKLFLKRLGELNSEDGTSAACKEAYDKTLAKHHPLIIRSGAKIAMYTLPTRNVMLTRVCGDQEHINEAMDHLPETLEVASIVYDRIENIYTTHDLHKLP